MGHTVRSYHRKEIRYNFVHCCDRNRCNCWQHIIYHCIAGDNINRQLWYVHRKSRRPCVWLNTRTLDARLNVTFLESEQNIVKCEFYSIAVKTASLTICRLNGSVVCIHPCKPVLTRVCVFVPPPQLTLHAPSVQLLRWQATAGGGSSVGALDTLSMDCIPVKAMS